MAPAISTTPSRGALFIMLVLYAKRLSDAGDRVESPRKANSKA
jgi:hypothetical protein